MYIENMTLALDKRDSLVTLAQCIGWTVLQIPRVSRLGLPFIKDMYSDAAKRFPGCLFYAYANGDILFNRGLTATLRAVSKV